MLHKPMATKTDIKEIEQCIKWHGIATPIIVVPFKMLDYCVLKYPLKCVPVMRTSENISTSNDDGIMLQLATNIAYGQ